MMARPIQHFLKEFASGEDEQAYRPPLPRVASQADMDVARPAAVPDLAAIRVQEAYQQGLAAGRAMEREAAEAQAAELAVDYARRVDEVRQSFTQQLADGIAAELRDGIEGASAQISTHVATALMPFLRQGLTQVAIDSFVRELGNLIKPSEGLSIDVFCPPELLDALRTQLGAAMAARGVPPGSVRCIGGEITEIRVQLNDSVIETRLRDWLSRLEGVLR